MSTHIIGIYSITHIHTGRRYIGQSSKIRTRWNAHRSMLRKGIHYARHLQSAWAKYGEDAFSFEVLEECAVDDLIQKEQHYIDLHLPKFNTAMVAGTRRGVPQPPEAIEKMRANSTGRVKTAEQRARLSAALKGRKLSPEHCAKIREAKSNPSEETRRRISEARRGRLASAETKAKMSAARKGRNISEAQKAKLSAIFKGRQFSAATRAKMSAANNTRGRVHTPQARENMRLASIAREAKKRERRETM